MTIKDRRSRGLWAKFAWGSSVVAALSLSLAPAGVATAGGAEDGQLIFNNACRTCHSLDPGDNRLGPNLAGILGREAGAADGYAYSSALQKGGFAWDEAKLDAFIANPDGVVPGHNMKPYAGMTDEAQRKTLVEFLKTK